MVILRFGKNKGHRFGGSVKRENWHHLWANASDLSLLKHHLFHKNFNSVMFDQLLDWKLVFFVNFIAAGFQCVSIYWNITAAIVKKNPILHNLKSLVAPLEIIQFSSWTKFYQTVKIKWMYYIVDRHLERFFWRVSYLQRGRTVLRAALYSCTAPNVFTQNRWENWNRIRNLRHFF